MEEDKRPFDLCSRIVKETIKSCEATYVYDFEAIPFHIEKIQRED